MKSDLQASYDRLAEIYTEHIAGELAHKPFDRTMLDWLVQRVGLLSPICDVGCGPGHIARYLHDRGGQVSGIDLSAEMVRQAQRITPGIDFRQGNMLDLNGVADEAFGGIAAFYSIIHVPREQVSQALCELQRVLRPGGWLLVTFHIGSEIRHLEELWGTAVQLDFVFFKREEMKGYLQAAGFTLQESIERDPYPDVEVQTRRAYLFARK